jgi:hypothetical protein
MSPFRQMRAFWRSVRHPRLLAGLLAAAATGMAAAQDDRGLATFGDRFGESFGTRPLESLGPIPLGSVGGLDEVMKARRAASQTPVDARKGRGSARRDGRVGRDLPIRGSSRRPFDIEPGRGRTVGKPQSVATLKGAVVAAVEEPPRFLLPPLRLPPLVLPGEGAREELAAALDMEARRLIAIGDHSSAVACRPARR